MILDRLKKLEAAVASIRIVTCERCHDGDAVFIEMPRHLAANGGSPDLAGQQVYGENRRCLTCGHVPNYIMKIITPGYRHAVDQRQHDDGGQ